MIPSHAIRWSRPVLLFALALPAAAREHTPPAVEPASRFAAVETHTDEKISIAAEPYDTKEKCALFRVDYLRRGVLPVRLVVTNNGDRPISLDQARILFESASGERIQAAEPEDVERRFSLKDKTGAKIPMPTPLPSLHTKARAHDKEVEQDFDTFEYSATTIAPHTTRSGFLFYVIDGPTASLAGAHLIVRKLLTDDGHELFAFEIPFDKYLRSKSGQMN
jgi:hypothetical protein